MQTNKDFYKESDSDERIKPSTKQVATNINSNRVNRLLSLIGNKLTLCSLVNFK
jgi:hypothetical protein